MAKGVSISIDANELHRLARDLNGTGERLRRGRQKFIRDHLVTYLEQSTEEAFEEQEDPETGEKWEEWTERINDALKIVHHSTFIPLTAPPGGLYLCCRIMILTNLSQHQIVNIRTI